MHLAREYPGAYCPNPKSYRCKCRPHSLHHSSAGGAHQSTAGSRYQYVGKMRQAVRPATNLSVPYLYTGVLSPDGSKILGTSRYETSLIINAKTGVIEKSLADHTNVSTNGTWSKDETFFIVTGGHDQTLTIRMRKHSPYAQVFLQMVRLIHPLFRPTALLFVLRTDPGVNIIDVATKRIVKTKGPETYFGSFSIDVPSVCYGENSQLKTTACNGRYPAPWREREYRPGAPGYHRSERAYIFAAGRNEHHHTRTHR